LGRGLKERLYKKIKDYIENKIGGLAAYFIAFFKEINTIKTRSRILK